MKLNELEQEAVRLLLSGCSERFEPEHLIVEDRRISKAGWMLDFKQDQTSALTGQTGIVLNDVYPLLNGNVPVGFLLYTEAGRVSALECHIYDENHPDKIFNFVFLDKADIDRLLAKTETSPTLQK